MTATEIGATSFADVDQRSQLRRGDRQYDRHDDRLYMIGASFSGLFSFFYLWLLGTARPA